MKKSAIIGVLFFATLAAAPQVFALNVFTNGTTYSNPATVLGTTSGTPQMNLYKSMGSLPVANDTGTLASDWSSQNLAAYSWNTGSFTGTVDGSYELVGVNSTSCNGLSYAACIAANTGVHISEWDFTVGPAPTPSPVFATSTPDQAQQNLAAAVYIFLFAMFGMIWLLRKH